MATADNHQSHITQSRDDRAGTLSATHLVERLAEAAGPNRPGEWRDDLLVALDDLASSLYDQFRRSAGDDGLLAQLIIEAPNLAPSVNQLRAAQSNLLAELDDLRQDLSDLARTVDVAVVRGRVSELTRQIRELRAWEVDLVYEALDLDLGTGD
jgi:ATP phosphoribosyltransferase regulatory subunit HisZ